MKLSLAKSKNIKLYGLIVLSLVAMTTTVIYTARKYFDSPAIGKVEASLVSSNNKIELLEFQGKVFSFSYPSYFKPTQTTSLSPSDVEKYAFTATQTSNWNLSIKVSNLTVASLDSDSSYKLRKSNPGTYSEIQIKLGINDANIMSSNAGGYSKVAFLLNGAQDATISLSSNSSIDSDRLDAALDQIISSWKWQ